MKRIVLILSVVTLFLLNSSQVQKGDKPNVLFIIADDLRPEIKAFGVQEIHTPNMDKLAAESAVFERAYCNIPVCGASRASLMSGIRPGRFRFLSHPDYLNEHYPGAKSIPRVLKENGYTTISNGKIFHQKKDEENAWDEIWKDTESNWLDYLTEENINIVENAKAQGNRERGLPYEAADVEDAAYTDGKMTLKVLKDLRKFSESGEPFFLTAGFLKPHLPFNAPKKYWDLYDREDFELPKNYQQPASTPRVAYHNSGELRHYSSVPEKGLVSEEMAKKLIHGYYACVSYIDAQLGLILNELKRTGLDKNTVIVLIGDHGWNLGNHQLWNKHCNFETSLRTPLILKVPGVTSGQRIDKIVEFVDIFPTISELTSTPMPKTVSGESLIPTLTNGKRGKDFAIAQWGKGLTLVKNNYFYTEWFDNEDNITDRMLFDHKTDPVELDNLAEKPEYTSLVTELSTILRKNRGEDFWVDRRLEK